MSLREAEHCAAECRRYCDRLIAGAANKPDPTARIGTLKIAVRVPDRTEVDRAVRAWVLEREAEAATATRIPSLVKQQVKDFRQMAEITPAHMREDRRTSLLETQWVADSIAEAHGWQMAERGLADYLFDRVGRAQREVALRIKAELNFEDRPAPTHSMFEPTAFATDRVAVVQQVNAPVPIMELFESYLSERQPAPKSVKKFRAALVALIEHLGHDDAARVTPEDIIAWKTALLLPAKGKKLRNPATVRNGYLGGVQPTFAWAKDNRKIAMNPVAGVTVRVPKRITNRAEKGYTSAEAKLVLGAALAVDCKSDESHGAFARRWLPWLCAYTGARITEMAQLRRTDLQQDEDGIWFVAVRPDAGSQKGHRARHVPLHPHLIEQGFPSAVSRRDGPLFYDRTNWRGGTGNSQAQKAGRRVGDWIRALGVDDEELQPNHGWRHAFISHGRGIIDEDVRCAITGHSGRGEHARYGNVSLRTMYAALNMFPRYNT